MINRRIVYSFLNIEIIGPDEGIAECVNLPKPGDELGQTVYDGLIIHLLKTNSSLSDRSFLAPSGFSLPDILIKFSHIHPRLPCQGQHRQIYRFWRNKELPVAHFRNIHRRISHPVLNELDIL